MPKTDTVFFYLDELFFFVICIWIFCYGDDFIYFLEILIDTYFRLYIAQ